MPYTPCMLLIEDSPGECELFQVALAQTDINVELYTAYDGEAALHFLTNRLGPAPLPSVILLDWHLQKKYGDGFLIRLRSDARFAHIPVVIFTTSDSTADVIASYSCGANGYVVKPGTYGDLVQFLSDFCRFWLQWNRTPMAIAS